MQDNLVIVESPAKAKTIEKFLGKDYKVMSSYGHIRDLKHGGLGIDEKTLEPIYEVSPDKVKIVTELKRNAKDAKKVWLASDEDREGEAISWHLCEVLGLDEEKTSRIVFHEITKPAILKAIETPRHLDMNLVDAQQARRVLDRLVGFKISPVLWRKVKPSLSAGRVQSVAVRLIVEQEREIQKFKGGSYYRIQGIFGVTNPDGSKSEVRARLDKNFKTHEEALAFLEKCKDAQFVVDNVTKKPGHSSSPSPFTTSTLQQEAARRLGFTVSQTMSVAQRLYESGRITYMRTDSMNLSQLAINASKEVITRLYGEKYSAPHRYHTHSKGAQEAHEAIRPTDMSLQKLEGNTQEARLYGLIWKRTVASQMADSIEENTTVTIDVDGADEQFVATGKVMVFDGYKKVYMDTHDSQNEEEQYQLPPLKVNDRLERREISSVERFLQAPPRYTEASLVRKLEELGIGRPSTYAPTISTIQQREYVVKGDRKGEDRPYIIDTLRGNVVTQKKKVETVGSDKGKLLPTDIGMVVNDFLMENFPEIMDYNFTANVESEFDKIAAGKEEWLKMIRDFDKNFEKVVDKVANSRSDHRVGERELGIDPKSGRPVFVKIGKFGTLVQIGQASDEEKPRFAQLPKELSMETVTLDEALELFKLPRQLGEFEGTPVTVGAGRFGPYVQHDKKYVSIPKDQDPLTITLAEAVQLILKKRQAEKERHIKVFEEDDKLELLNGRYGPYLCYDGKNYRIDKKLHEQARKGELTFEQCMEIVKNTPESKSRRRK
ncbi:MAG: type I DNA topoisomerase [Prevotella sp.]